MKFKAVCIDCKFKKKSDGRLFLTRDLSCP